jgi:hypothetical protein
VPLLAYVLPNWRSFTAACGLSVIFPLALAHWIPESPRWLLLQVCLLFASPALANMFLPLAGRAGHRSL